MFIFKTLILTMALLSFGSQSLASVILSENAGNLIVQQCANTGGVSIKVVNMDGQCQAFWKCDDLTFEVACGNGQCECQNESAGFVNSISYEDCDSDKLVGCFNLPR